MAAGRANLFTADGQSDFKIIKTIVFNSTTADTLELREGSSTGTVRLSLIIAAAGVAVIPLGEGIVSETGNWYVDVTTTGAPKITLIGH